MKKTLFVVFLILCAQPCFALLSPLNQSIEEIQSLLQNPELQQHFPQDQPLLSIHRSSNGYLLSTLNMQMFVEIQYIPADRPGKQQYKLIFHDATMKGMRR